MFPTAMDTNPLPPSGEQSTSQPVSDSAPLASPAPSMLGPSMLADVRRESPFREVFAGPDGMYAGTRWLIYLLMGGTVLVIEGALMHFVHPEAGGPVWWSMVTRKDVGPDSPQWHVAWPIPGLPNFPRLGRGGAPSPHSQNQNQRRRARTPPYTTRCPGSSRPARCLL